MIRVGIIGLGFMGAVHLRNWQGIDGAEVVAVCNAGPVNGKAKLGNINAGSDTLDLSGISIYTDITEMLSNETLDAVSIALPTHLHKIVSIQCMETGVHVLCEKPMALTVADCDAMIATASRAGKELMIAHCIRFWPAYEWVKSMVESREYGDVFVADFSRLTYAPAWDSVSWLSDSSKSGGIVLDLHIHDLDFIQYLFGAPASIRSVCSKSRYVHTQVGYDDDRVISATASWMMPESFGFKMDFTILFEKAAVIFDGTALTVYPENGEPFSPAIESGDGYKREIEFFYSLVSGIHENMKMPSTQARESVRMALEALSI